MLAKFPNHLDEGVNFGGIAVVVWGKVHYRGFEAWNEHLPIRQIFRVDEPSHEPSISKCALGCYTSTVNVDSVRSTGR